MHRFTIADHLISFLKSPIGYMVNLVGTATCWIPWFINMPLDHIVCPLCETFCLQDGIQDDWHPLIPAPPEFWYRLCSRNKNV